MPISLTSLSEIQEVFSTEGVDNHMEDLINSPEVVNTFIARATERCLLYLRTHYADEDIEPNIWAREQATYIACYLISVRRGNPSLYSDLYAQALIDLELVRDGKLNPGIPSNARAVVQTPILDSRFYLPMRTNPHASTRILPGQKVPRYPYQVEP